MKHFLLTAIAVAGLAVFAKAQKDSTKIDYGQGVAVDTTKTKENVKRELAIAGGLLPLPHKDLSTSKGRFVGGITFTRLDIGFARLIDNGSFSLSPANEFLDYRGGKTSTLSFDVLQFGYRFNSNFKVYLAGGFDWTHIRLRNNITMQKNTPDLAYTTENIQLSKNRFSASYVHVPLNFELRSKENKKGKRLYCVLGPEIGFLLNGKVKQISEERGKEKFRDDYNFAPFRYGGVVRLGYGALGIFAKYYASDMFDATAQKGLKSMAFGISLGIN